ncbi:MAG TPA: hypothetical protein VHM19_15695 [Polyangiales bacterium]|nr:hypothetical protein [Polyangiales bacterium]
MAGLSREAEVRTGIGVDRDHVVEAAVEIFLHAHDRGGFARERKVENVAAFAGPQAHAVAARKRGLGALLGAFRLVQPAVFVSGIAAALATIYAITLLCGAYPSWLASTVEPAEALRYE